MSAPTTGTRYVVGMHGRSWVMEYVSPTSWVIHTDGGYTSAEHNDGGASPLGVIECLVATGL
jgi:hypothetical protein